MAKASLATTLCVMMLLGSKPDELAEAARSGRSFKEDENGFIDLGEVNKAFTGVLKIVIILTIVGATIGLLITSIADIVHTITTETTNNTTVDLLRPILGLIVAFAGLFAIVKRVFAALG
jgi:hypothetical protein